MDFSWQQRRGGELRKLKTKLIFFIHVIVKVYKTELIKNRIQSVDFLKNWEKIRFNPFWIK
jgi:hypothetical protein